MQSALIPGLALFFAVAACSTPDHYGPTRERLTQDLALLDGGQLSSASRDLEALLSDTAPLAKELEVQRFYAAYLLTQAHVRASLGAPFISDGTHASTSGIGGGEAGAGSETAHVVATMLYANIGKDLAAKAKGGSIREKGIELLPEPLRDLAPANAEASLDVAMLAVYSRLGFEDRVVKTLDASPALHDLDRCEKLLADARVDPGLCTWVHSTVFRYLSTRDEPAAYKFGVKLLECAANSDDPDTKARANEAIAWIRDGSNFTFRCPSCNQPVVPELRACQNDQTSNLSFYAEPRQKP